MPRIWILVGFRRVHVRVRLQFCRGCWLGYRHRGQRSRVNRRSAILESNVRAFHWHDGMFPGWRLHVDANLSASLQDVANLLCWYERGAPVRADHWGGRHYCGPWIAVAPGMLEKKLPFGLLGRSEERRVGKECRSR